LHHTGRAGLEGTFHWRRGGTGILDSWLADDAVMVFPGGMLIEGKAPTLGAIGSQLWTSFRLDRPRVIRLSDTAAVVVYGVTARHGCRPIRRPDQQLVCPAQRAVEAGIAPANTRMNVAQPGENGGAVDRRLTARLSGRLSRVDAPGGSRAPGSPSWRAGLLALSRDIPLLRPSVPAPRYPWRPGMGALACRQA
jgi:hypothetical protein